MRAETGNLPAGWEMSTLGELCHPSQYGWTTKAAPEGDVKFLRTTDITHGPVNWSTVPFCSELPADLARYLLIAGDIVISRAGSVGFSALLDEPPQHTVFASYLIRFRPRDSRMSRFIALYLQSPRYWRDVGAQAAGIALANINARKLSAIPVPVPPLAEQDRIIVAWERTIAAVDDGETNFRTALQGAARLKGALLGELFASGYPSRSLDSVGTVFLGFTPSRNKPELWQGNVPWVSSREVAFTRISETAETISEAALGNRDLRLNPPGTVLLAMYGEGRTRGQVAILDIEAATNQAVAAIRLDPEVMLPEFLYFCLMGLYAAIRAAAQGGQQKNLNGKLVRAIEVPCPTLGEQLALVENLKRRLADGERIAETLRGNIASSAVLRRSILHHAVTGRLVQQGSIQLASGRATRSSANTPRAGVVEE